MCYSVKTISQTEEAMVKAFFKKSVAVTLALVVCLIVSAGAYAAELLPEISWHNMATTDAVAAKNGEHGVCGEFLHRNGDVMVPFADVENREAYAKDPAAYPIVGWVVERLAAGGMDMAARFPNGVRDSKLGPLVMGNPGEYMVAYKGANFAFANAANMAAFKKNPEAYMLPVGGYCLGAMAADRVTRGNLQHVLWIPELKIYATFGSENGPIAWRAMSPEQRIAKYREAQANYDRRTGQHLKLVAVPDIDYVLGRQAVNDNLQQGGRKKLAR